jgi:hypothetical protein
LAHQSCGNCLELRRELVFPRGQIIDAVLTTSPPVECPTSTIFSSPWIAL